MKNIKIALSVLFGFISPGVVAAADDESKITPLKFYSSEAEAAKVGTQLGIGSTNLEGPTTVEALTHDSWTLVYTAGKAGIHPQGGIRIAMRHVPCWSHPQQDNPQQEGFLTAQTSNGATMAIVIGFNYQRYFTQYHPWQNIVEITFPDRGLEPGDTVRVNFGDRSQGSPGMRVQPFDETSFVLKCYVDPLGNGDYLPMHDNPHIEIVSAEVARLQLVTPSDAVVGRPVWCIVRVEDRYGNPAARYQGTVHLSAPNLKDTLFTHTFTKADKGVYRFESLVFTQAGEICFQAEDGIFQAKSNPVRVAESKPERLLLWGDIHGHTLFSDGRGTVEEYYDFAERVSGLDFCAVSDHAFEILDEMWEHSKKVTNRVYKPGSFVTFQAYEWSGVTDVGGDHNAYFLDDDPPLYRSDSYYDRFNFQMDHDSEKVKHVEELFAKLRAMLENKNVLCIPHFGGRHGNPEWHDPKVQRMIEIFSEHQRSEAWATTFLKKGFRLGIMASGDDHFGNPGYGYLKPGTDWNSQEIGKGLVAVYAEERTRESVFRALYDRHVYATSGDRIILDFRADGHPMGSEYESRETPLLHIECVGTAPLASVELKKNSDRIHEWKPGSPSFAIDRRDEEFKADRTSYYYVRVMQTNGEEAISSPIWIN